MTLDTRAGQGGGPHTCARCRNHRMRHQHEGPTTIVIGSPELRCAVDGSYRSPEISRECPAFQPFGASVDA